jgi:hypothetical protein
MEAKQTAVQWLKDKLFELEIKIDSKTHEEAFFIFEQAKQMEKEQIKQAFNTDKSWFTLYIEQNEGLNLSEKYYNETYGK